MFGRTKKNDCFNIDEKVVECFNSFIHFLSLCCVLKNVKSHCNWLVGDTICGNNVFQCDCKETVR